MASCSWAFSPSLCSESVWGSIDLRHWLGLLPLYIDVIFLSDAWLRILLLILWLFFFFFDWCFLNMLVVYLSANSKHSNQPTSKTRWSGFAMCIFITRASRTQCLSSCWWGFGPYGCCEERGLRRKNLGSVSRHMGGREADGRAVGSGVRKWIELEKRKQA